MSSHRWWTVRDSTPLDAKGMQQGALTTVIGLVAGLAMAAIVITARDLQTTADVTSSRFLWGLAIAGLFAVSAFGRGKTHFAKPTEYDLPLLGLDIPMVLLGGAVVGLLSRGDYSFDRWIWTWLFFFLLFLNFRNWYLIEKHKEEELIVGVILLVFGKVMVGSIWIFWPTNEPVASVAGFVGLGLVIIEFVVEIAIPFQRSAARHRTDGGTTQKEEPMAKWRVQYKAPDGSMAQTSVDLDVSTAKDARRKILDGECNLIVTAEALVAVEKMKEGGRL